MTATADRTPAYISTYSKGGVSYSLPVPVQAGKDSFVVNESLDFPV
ncbi:MAG: hypothetical protein ABIQ74_01500 [Chitinophagales bacterium]